MKNYGANLKQIRISRGLTLKDIENQTGINNGNLSRWERNEVQPSIEACVKLAEFYDISVDELLGVSDNFIPAYNSSMSSYSSEELEIIKKFRELNASGKKLILQTLDTLNANTKQKSQSAKA